MAIPKRKYIKESYTTDDVRNLADEARAAAYRIGEFLDQLYEMSDSDNDADAELYDEIECAMFEENYRDYDEMNFMRDFCYDIEHVKDVLNNVAHGLYKII